MIKPYVTQHFQLYRGFDQNIWNHDRNIYITKAFVKSTRICSIWGSFAWVPIQNAAELCELFLSLSIGMLPKVCNWTHGSPQKTTPSNNLQACWPVIQCTIWRSYLTKQFDHTENLIIYSIYMKWSNSTISVVALYSPHHQQLVYIIYTFR